MRYGPSGEPARRHNAGAARGRAGEAVQRRVMPRIWFDSGIQIEAGEEIVDWSIARGERLACCEKIRLAAALQMAHDVEELPELIGGVDLAAVDQESLCCLL